MSHKLNISNYIIKIPITRGWFIIVPFNKEEMSMQCICLKLVWNTHLHCPGISRNADDWAVVVVSAVYDTRAALCLKSHLRLQAKSS